FAARAQHINTLIKPALSAGKWVLCDRFSDSTVAYQGFGRGLPQAWIEELKLLVQRGLEPDCSFLLDAPLSIGMERARGRAVSTGEVADRFEQEHAAFFERVQQGFHWLAQHNRRMRRIDAAQPLPQVQEQLIAALRELTGL